MIQDAIKNFSTSKLNEACFELMKELNITLRQQPTYESIDFPALYKKKWGKVPMCYEEAFQNIDKTYIIGEISDESLSKSDIESFKNDFEAIDEKYQSVMIFAVSLKEDAKMTRSMTANLTRSFNRMSKAKPVILFVKKENKLSLATCERMDYESQAWRDGEKLGKVNLLSDIDCLQPHRGHIEILDLLGKKKCSTFSDLDKHWLSVFSSELLTKKFYTDLFKWYQWVALDKEVKFSFPNDLSDKTDDAANNLHITRLITRLMFVWFLKQMGLVPSKLFDKEVLRTEILKDFDPTSNSDGSYYNAILQNLFFATLNQEIKDRAFAGDSEFQGKSAGYGDKALFRDKKKGSYFRITHDEVLYLFNHVPYLNGGLFECLDKTDKKTSKVYYYDGFSREEKRQAHIPNVAFFDSEKGLISLFEKYHFTIEENTPYDKQVALDPELLGKVFENLLAYINPDDTGGKESARKASGSYYTPREIVNYMVNESLVAHLKTKVGDDDRLEKEYRKLISYGEEEIELTDKEKKAITQAIFECKILDPACGSGAFPMGMLQQLVHVLEKLDKGNVLWKEVVKQQAAETSASVYTSEQSKAEREERLAEIEETFTRCIDYPDYTRKLYLIENCIHGVDIQPIAIQISKLRFFISLVISQAAETQKYTKEQNYGIQALPNLGTKFVCANTLIPAELKQYEKTLFDDDALHKKQQELLEIRHQYFYAKRSKKKLLANRDEQICQEISVLLSASCTGPDKEKIAIQQAAIDSLEKEIVRISSLPQNRKTEADLKDRKKRIKEAQKVIDQENKKSKPAGFDEAVTKLTQWDPYDAMATSPFFDVEWMFGIKDGFDVVIGNPPYVPANELKKQMGTERYNNFKKNFVTSKGTVDFYVYFFEKGIYLLRENGCLAYITPNKFLCANYAVALREFFLQHTQFIRFWDVSDTQCFKASVYPVVSILYKRSSQNYQFNVKARNEADLEYESNVLGSLPEYIWGFLLSDKINIVRKIISNSIKLTDVCSINATSTASEADKFHSYITDEGNGIRLINTGTIDPYVSLWGRKALVDKGCKYYQPRILNEVSILGVNRANMYNSSKIIIAKMASKVEGFFDQDGNYASINTNCLHRLKVDPKLVLAWIHSKVFNFVYEVFFDGLRMAGGYMPYSAPYLSCMYYPKFRCDQQLPIITLINQILATKKSDPFADTTAEEHKIDRLVYDLYGLTEDEIAIVEGAN